MVKLLLTGAAGRLGSYLHQWLAERGHEVLATDIRQPDDGPPLTIADLADRGAVDALMARGVDAIVHMGGLSTEARWEDILNANIAGTYNVFEAARHARVRRIVYASSYHVVGMYPTVQRPLGVEALPRPDSLYGVSKIFGETLARLYYDKFGLECLAIRICTANPPKTTRETQLWCSREDLANLIETALLHDKLGYRIVFGVSANAGAFYANPADSDLGWSPHHNSAELGLPFAGLPLDPADPLNERHGGIFAIWGHFED
ncbi:MAG TPA: NAD(P)-dependent oxidoreductase [Devosia sp.]|jgi:uronate dehydrogenase|uniref:NAD-dependent epimerase/dehydratase family protein n=1 Tax=Devosia sp. TaxID=1871048 RepID=UPI002F94601D